jgi:hypothetical protein
MKSRTFNARKMFQYAILCVRAMVRIRRLRFTPEPLSMDVARVDPYRIKVLRKVSSFLISELVYTRGIHNFRNWCCCPYSSCSSAMQQYLIVLVLTYLGSQCKNLMQLGGCPDFMSFYLESCIWPDSIPQCLRQ